MVQQTSCTSARLHLFPLPPSLMGWHGWTHSSHIQSGVHHTTGTLSWGHPSLSLWAANRPTVCCGGRHLALAPKAFTVHTSLERQSGTKGSQALCSSDVYKCQRPWWTVSQRSHKFFLFGLQYADYTAFLVFVNISLILYFSLKGKQYFKCCRS